MNNQNALTSTAMLASIWEKEKKDTIELILPFVTYGIGKTTSIGNQINIATISSFVSVNFGFHNMPNSVLHKVFTRLVKKSTLATKNRQFFLQEDLSTTCSNIDFQNNQAKTQTDTVIMALTNYLNKKKEHLFKKDMSVSDVQSCFVGFLESKGYFIYTEISKLRELTRNESTLHYHISQFILTEHDKESDLFLYINNIVKGLLLSRVIYGYTDLQYREKFKDVCIYLDTALLLRVFGFKSYEENTSAAQFIEILRNDSVPIKCFNHNYTEIYKIIDAFKHNIHSPSSRYGHTLEYFVELNYSAFDMDRVLLNLEDYFKEKNIEVVDTPSLSSDGTGKITHIDFSSALGVDELKKHLSSTIQYRSDDALDNDVNSIAAIYTLRRGKQFKKIEQCKALFVTTNRKLTYCTQTYVNNTDGIVPLLINDIELTTLLWLKNHKRFSDLPTLKLIEVARLSLEPTIQIRTEFIKKIEQFKNEPTVTDEMAASYRQLIYNEQEKVMELIAANPENIKNIQLNDLEDLSRQHYNSALTNENQDLKRHIDETTRRLWADATIKINKAGNRFSLFLQVIAYLALVAILAIGIIGLFKIEQTDDYYLLSIMLLVFSAIGIFDTIVPRLRYVNRLIMILTNKRKASVRKQEQERIKKIVGDKAS